MTTCSCVHGLHGIASSGLIFCIIWQAVDGAFVSDIDRAARNVEFDKDTLNQVAGCMLSWTSFDSFPDPHHRHKSFQDRCPPTAPQQAHTVPWPCTPTMSHAIC